ncbi:MAG TPA: 4-demethylwyosine synthase TYW1 [Candidatus Thermoplasmatota archaeon]|nr:4-demethylwyosine synthase TYW1 [Candidatus Thermoplasmatota archaeon]
MDAEYQRILERQHYGIVGHHSAVKVCHWTKEQLAHGRGCYKNTFYGIQSHRCVQMTPMASYCNKTCLYCWRMQGWESQVQGPFDEPTEIWEGSLAQQKRLLSGYKGMDSVTTQGWDESQAPRHVAISLTGEPTFYPKLGAFLALCHDRGITTFLVTNGTTPEVLAGLDPKPTQLYVSVDAPDAATFEKLGVPTTPRAWEKLQQSLALLPRLGCRTVLRHTVVKGWNMHLVDGFAAVDAPSRADFIECKAYEYVGPSRDRMSWDNVPTFAEVRAFAERLGAQLGYVVEDERADSRVVLLMRPGAARFLWDDPRSQALYGAQPLGPRTPGTHGTAPKEQDLAVPTPTSIERPIHLHVVHEHHGHDDAEAGAHGGDGCGGCGGGAGAGNATLR